MTYDTPPPPARTETTVSTPIDVDMRQRQGDLRQTGRQQLNQDGQLRQDGTLRQDGRLQQNGTLQQNADGNTLRTGDVRSSNQIEAGGGGAAIDNHSTVNKTDKSVGMGSQFLPECTVGLSIGVPGSGAFQIGVPSKECIRERGKATEALAASQADIARSQADATIAIARANAMAAIRKAETTAAESIARTEADKEVALQKQDDSHVQAMTKIACDFSVDRAGTARQSWQQFESVSGKIGRHPTAKAGAQQLWGEAVTASAQSMEAGAVCVESTRSQLGIEAKKFEIPKLEFETPKPVKPAPKPPERKEDCPEKDGKK